MPRQSEREELISSPERLGGGPSYRPENRDPSPLGDSINRYRNEHRNERESSDTRTNTLRGGGGVRQ